MNEDQILKQAIIKVVSELNKLIEPMNARLIVISELFLSFVDDQEADPELMEAAAPLMKLIKDRGFNLTLTDAEFEGSMENTDPSKYNDVEDFIYAVHHNLTTKQVKAARDHYYQARTVAISDHINKMRILPVCGNYHSDSDLWGHCHVVAACETLPMKIRLEALAKMNELTGENDPCTEEALNDYLRQNEE